jgi:hypothetical protein
MAGKLNGLGWTTFSVQDNGGTLRDIKNDIKSADFATPRGVIETTGLDKYGYERILGLVDFTGTMNGTFNVDTNKSHDVFKTVASSSSTARTINITVAGVSLGVTPALTVLLTDYPISRSDSGELTWAVPFALASGDVPAWT